MYCGVFSQEKCLVLSCTSTGTTIGISNVTKTVRSTVCQLKSFYWITFTMIFVVVLVKYHSGSQLQKVKIILIPCQPAALLKSQKLMAVPSVPFAIP